MKDTVFLFIKVTIQTSHARIREAIRELETETSYFIGSTKTWRYWKPRSSNSTVKI